MTGPGDGRSSPYGRHRAAGEEEPTAIIGRIRDDAPARPDSLADVPEPPAWRGGRGRRAAPANEPPDAAPTTYIPRVPATDAQTTILPAVSASTGAGGGPGQPSGG
ncbi:MAG TPA: hypothetical protein VES42_25530, partial [Pilimelia sp.]|nr:hypothetical protein [Pilimelia sp.]